jgi:hypothetical protein
MTAPTPGTSVPPPEAGGRHDGAAGQCFVIGCERSGTSPLVRVMHAHPAMVMGLERYATLYNEMRRVRDPQMVGPELFTPPRFLDFRPGDTRKRPPDFGEPHYEVARNRFAAGGVAYVGDKVLPPNLWLMRTMVDRFPDARFVFIYRDLLRVCSSWQRRADDPEDRWKPWNDHRAGHNHWVDASNVVEWFRHSSAADRLFVVRCEWFFAEDPASCEALVRFLDLDMDPSMEASHTQRGAEFRRREAASPDGLTDEQHAYVLAHAETERAVELDQMARHCLVRP